AGGATATTSGARVGDNTEMVVLSQTGPSGFHLAVEGTKAVLQLSGSPAVGREEASTGAPPGSRHCTPEGTLPAPGAWFKLSAAVARDTSKGVDQVG
ncbi:unnamed protein product, partial [Sphacelaria rigidula]